MTDAARRPVRRPDPTVAAYRTGAFLSRVLPGPLTDAVVQRSARVLARRTGDRRAQVVRNLGRINGGPLDEQALERAVGDTFASYARYYSESFRLPTMSPAEIEAGFTDEGFEHIRSAVDSGTGPILVMPHLGSWEWAAFWLTAVHHIEVTAVVEPLEPPELFDWFMSFREALGMHVVSLEEPGIGARLVTALNDANVVCLLSDRLVGGAGVEVEFFGEATRLPAGPATLALRTGAALLPVGVYQRTKGTHGWCRPPVPAEREGKLRADVQRVTQDLAHEMEILIRAAPEQWHLMQPNWPSDPGYRSNKGT